MKARLPRVCQISESTLKDIKIESRKQCIEQLKQYEMEIDSVTLWVLHNYFQFGKQRLEKFYDLMFQKRQEMQDEFGETDDSTIGEFAMRWQLKQEGIDVEEMFNRQKSRFKVKIK